MRSKYSSLVFGLIIGCSATAFAEEERVINSVAVETSLIPLMNQLVMDNSDGVDLIGTANIPQMMINGDVQVGISSRKWTDKEVAKFQHEMGYRPTELYFTADVVAVLANKDNPNSFITMEEVIDVFGCNQEIIPARWQKWNDGEPPVMEPFAIDGGLKLHHKFNQWITCKPNYYTATQYVVDSDELVDKMEASEASIAYVTYSSMWDEYKLLSIVDKRGDRFSVNKETILSGRYPLSSVYYMYVDLPPHRNYLSDSEKRFINLALNSEHKEQLNQFGFISLPEEAIRRNKVRLGLEQPLIEGGYK